MSTEHQRDKVCVCCVEGPDQVSTDWYEDVAPNTVPHVQCANSVCTTVGCHACMSDHAFLWKMSLWQGHLSNQGRWCHLMSCGEQNSSWLKPSRGFSSRRSRSTTHWWLSWCEVFSLHHIMTKNLVMASRLPFLWFSFVVSRPKPRRIWRVFGGVFSACGRRVVKFYTFLLPGYLFTVGPSNLSGVPFYSSSFPKYISYIYIKIYIEQRWCVQDVSHEGWWGDAHLPRNDPGSCCWGSSLFPSCQTVWFLLTLLMKSTSSPCEWIPAADWLLRHLSITMCIFCFSIGDGGNAWQSKMTCWLNNSNMVDSSRHTSSVDVQSGFSNCSGLLWQLMVRCYHQYLLSTLDSSLSKHNDDRDNRTAFIKEKLCCFSDICLSWSSHICHLRRF